MAQRTATTDTAEVTGRSATARGRPALGQGASPALDRYDRLFVATAFGIQVVLLLFFALRVWAFDAAMRVGWLVYALAVPALLVSAVLRGGRKPWYRWLAGVLYAGWALGGYVVDIARPVAWRAPIVWPVFLPYVALYLAAQMLYWWPLGTIRLVAARHHPAAALVRLRGAVRGEHRAEPRLARLALAGVAAGSSGCRNLRVPGR